jgi:hypothetical protein
MRAPAIIPHRGFEETLPGSYKEWVTSDSPRKKLVLGIDNFEELQVLEGWLRESFMGSMPDENVLLIVASRTDLMQAWYTDPVWQPYIDASRFPHLKTSNFINYSKNIP